MPNLNKVLLMGHLTRDVELKFTPKGSAIAKLGLATSRQWKSETGEKKEETLFVDIDVFGKQAETLAQYVKKGSALYVEGRMKLDQWDDKTTGQKRSKIGVVCESFQFIGGKGKEEAEPKPMAPKQPSAPPADDLPDESIPF